MSPEFSITTRDHPDVHIVSLHGELDIVSAYDLAMALVEIAGSTAVVDLSELTFMDSTGISALVMARKRILGDGRGRLVLTRPRGFVGKAFGDRGFQCVDRGLVARLGRIAALSMTRARAAPVRRLLHA